MHGGHPGGQPQGPVVVVVGSPGGDGAKEKTKL